jgi:Na+-driven multidrug efflux pump
MMGAYLLTVVFNFGLAGLWSIQSVDETARFFLNYYRFRRKKWKRVEIETLP